MSYHIKLENVVNTKNQDIKTMVDLGRYFSIFAPRESGKTTFFEGFCHELVKDTAYVAILLSFQDYKNLNSQRSLSTTGKQADVCGLPEA
ncbi:MAG: hypothetical protein LWX54_15815 [Deltaproteobacteria bacterium]|jgi:hypothetical protein|nr:hypothetical protein [Deltaproteobacteria bacterium]MDL1985620.1 hypothetical protein [Deltaproteobacteria bacterium]